MQLGTRHRRTGVGQIRSGVTLVEQCPRVPGLAGGRVEALWRLDETLPIAFHQRAPLEKVGVELEQAIVRASCACMCHSWSSPRCGC